MIKNNAVVLGFIYPGVENYLDDYFSSLSQQSTKCFDIYIYNDGFDNNLLEHFITRYKDLNIRVIRIENKLTPAEIREIAITDHVDKYNYMIFSDTDDYFSTNRVEQSINALQNFDFCYNDIYLVDNFGVNYTQNSYFRNKEHPNMITQYEPLLDKNFCGLSNTAINLKTVNLKSLKIPPELIAVDWWIFSILTINDYCGCFLSDAFTYYRQHDLNTVGGLNYLNEKQLLRGIKIKKDHYKLLLRYCSSKYNYMIQEEYGNIEQLDEIISGNNTILKNYLFNVNKEDKEYLWWENIKLNRRWLLE